jgi:hypothetical protein
MIVHPMAAAMARASSCFLDNRLFVFTTVSVRFSPATLGIGGGPDVRNVAREALSSTLPQYLHLIATDLMVSPQKGQVLVVSAAFSTTGLLSFPASDQICDSLSQNGPAGGMAWPVPLPPQHAMVPSVFAPHVWKAPALTKAKMPAGGVAWPRLL